MTKPALGLLLDVDGPLASPVTRTIAVPSIADDLVTLTGLGVPIAFITGRSDAFVRESVLGLLFERGLSQALEQPGARMFGVFEKGASWAAILPGGMTELEVDPTLAPPAGVTDEVLRIVESDFTDTMFWDYTKRAMISVEQRTDVSTADFVTAQEGLIARIVEVFTAAGVGLRSGDAEIPDARGAVPFRIDPTPISTDVESVLLDKDRAARRAVAYFDALGERPTVWRSVGDSAGDYKMADYLHSIGESVAHVDVKPVGSTPRLYPVLTEGDLIDDYAGAAFLRRSVGLVTSA